jgi:hypothetical protein
VKTSWLTPSEWEDQGYRDASIHYRQDLRSPHSRTTVTNMVEDILGLGPGIPAADPFSVGFMRYALLNEEPIP